MILTKAEVADILRVSGRTVQRLVAAGDITPLAGRPVRFLETDITLYVAKTKTRGKRERLCFQNQSVIKAGIMKSAGQSLTPKQSAAVRAVCLAARRISAKQ